VKQGWKRKWSPFGVLRKSPKCLSKYWLNRYARNRINQELPEQHRLDYKEFMKMTLLRPGSTEYALFVCFDHYFHAILPLDDENCLRGLDVPISFVYGDRDWMTNVGKHDLLSTNPHQGLHSHYYTLEDSDHNVFFDNPDGLVEIIRKDLESVIG
jgi:pimeloyl-ACP methyl ester carboxylesterase